MPTLTVHFPFLENLSHPPRLLISRVGGQKINTGMDYTVAMQRAI
ncbi:MAG: hypothetical protein RL622_854, partial [Actinomycetota bacterium]